MDVLIRSILMLWMITVFIGIVITGIKSLSGGNR